MQTSADKHLLVTIGDSVGQMTLNARGCRVPGTVSDNH